MSVSNLTGDCAVNSVGHGMARVPILGPIIFALGVTAYCNQPCDGVWWQNEANKWECVVDSGK